MTNPKITHCPSTKYQEYRADKALRMAQERARQSQPPMISLASKVPNYRIGD